MSASIHLTDDGSAMFHAAVALLNKRYARVGYSGQHVIPTGPNCMTFAAEIDGQVVGTITLAVDSDDGLPADEAFSDHLDKMRDLGCKLCELVKFAFAPGVSSMELMTDLFRSVFAHGSAAFDCDRLVIEVNSRHARYYSSAFGFKPVGDMRAHKIGVPLQLMVVRVDVLQTIISADASEASGVAAVHGAQHT